MSRELDAEVAEKVMGYRWYRHIACTKEVVLALPSAYFEDGTRFGIARGRLPDDVLDTGSAPPFSSDPAAAWEVVEKMRAQGRPFDCGSPHWRGVKLSEWWARFGTEVDEPARADTMPEAVCIAALIAVGARK